MRDLLGRIFLLSTLILTVDSAQAATAGHMFKSSNFGADTEKDITGSIKKHDAKSDDVTGSIKKPGAPRPKEISKPKTVPAQ